MRTINYITFFILAFASFILSQDIVIKSLKVYAGSDETSFPVVVQNGNGPAKITIEFDVQSNYVPNFNIIFRFCDHNWVPYNNIFLSNQGKNTYYDMHYSLLPNTVKAANYHFRESFPDDRGYVAFPFSGKWMFFITDSQDTSIVYGSGKFYFIRNDLTVSDTLKKEQLTDKIYFPYDLAKVFNITTNFYLPSNFYPAQVSSVEIVDNHKIDYPYVVKRGDNTIKRSYYWNGDRNFSFIDRDILPGNEYRQVDLRNTNIFIANDVNAHLDGIEYSRFYQEGPSDLNGGSILTNYNNDYATYMNVTFSIRPPSDVTGGIWLVGAFNNWKLTPEYMMKNNYGVYSITIPLKRGIYDYQYVTGSLENGKVANPDWIILEGNSWATSNVYQIFVYYKDQNFGGYDRIIGYKQITSNSGWKN